jgi:hypothetical protein
VLWRIVSPKHCRGSAPGLTNVSFNMRAGYIERR